MSSETEIRPFRVEFSAEEIADLRRRIAATRWPERETVTDDSQGVRLAMMQELAGYWGTDYDWRKCEAKLNALPQFITEIDGLDIHFIHVRSPHADALPLIVTHGWPGSIIEQLKIIEPLTNPTAHGGSAADAFHLVIPSLPGYGFSGKPTATGWDPAPHRTRLGHADEAPRVHPVRRAGRRLGRGRHAVDGRTGRTGVARHSLQHARDRSGGYQQGGRARRPIARALSGEEKRAYEQLSSFYAKHVAYALIMTTRPQTLYGLADSPDRPGRVHARPRRRYRPARARGTGPAGQPWPGALTRDDLLDNITLYWLTNTGVSSGRLYWENKADFFDAKNISIPFAISVFPDELYEAPRSWAERAYPNNLIYFNELDRGGHFAAWEQPELFTGEMRAAFRTLR
jgi:pimeloyl-ACP methyl ester carboxylesterase